MAAYSKADQVLHRLALQSAPLAEMSFDIDQKMVSTDPKAVAAAQHVFVSGLARAGTTALMRRFYGSGAFRSLTYRDMPFVLAPNLWRKLGGKGKRAGAKAERAHGDRIEVDVDSPESLDEVFWRIFCGEEYIGAETLVPHRPDDDVLDKYIRYVAAILGGQPDGPQRYLSKNNNNILRLPAIRAAFPHALILVPFRNPLAHAGSLQRQHANFLQMQRDDTFVTRYMTWLAHHEFGSDHRPFRFGPVEATGLSPDGLDYWLSIWTETYRFLERSAPADAIFVCYEELCSEPAVWNGLADRAGVERKTAGQEAFAASPSFVEPGEQSGRTQEAFRLYARLLDRSRADLKLAS